MGTKKRKLVECNNSHYIQWFNLYENKLTTLTKKFGRGSSVEYLDNYYNLKERYVIKYSTTIRCFLVWILVIYLAYYILVREGQNLLNEAVRWWNDHISDGGCISFANFGFFIMTCLSFLFLNIFYHANSCVKILARVSLFTFTLSLAIISLYFAYTVRLLSLPILSNLTLSQVPDNKWPFGASLKDYLAPPGDEIYTRLAAANLCINPPLLSEAHLLHCVTSIENLKVLFNPHPPLTPGGPYRYYIGHRLGNVPRQSYIAFSPIRLVQPSPGRIVFFHKDESLSRWMSQFALMDVMLPHIMATRHNPGLRLVTKMAFKIMYPSYWLTIESIYWLFRDV
jgi:hypothetical protein